MVSRHRFDVATWFWLAYGNWCRDPIFEVTTWAVLVGQKGGRDIGLMSRPGLVVQEVATWERCRDLALGWTRERGRDMRPRPGCYARDLRTLNARPALAARKTCARPAAVRATAPTTWALRSTWVLGVRTVHPTQFCDSALFRVTVGTLFMSTVHMVKKKEYKIFKNSLVYD